MILLALALLAIALATLWPASGPPPELSFCITCGSRGTADFLLNIALFMPLGVALSLRGRSRASVAAFAALLSTAIELTQFYIPGRDPSLGDVLANTSGAILGALVVRYAETALFPTPAAASRLSRGATIGAVLVCFATALLLTPTFPTSQYYGLWTPELGHLEHYGGRLLDATIGDAPIDPGGGPLPSHVRELLQSPTGYDVRVHALAGPRTHGLAPLLAIYDERRREILLLGVDRDDLVFRSWTRAARWRFDRPDARVHATPSPGDTLELRVAVRDGHYSINGDDQGFTVGHGWALLAYPDVVPAKDVVSAIWIGALFIPTGFWLRSRKDAGIAAVGLLSGLLLIPALTSLVATPPLQWVAGVLGIGLGALGGRRGLALATRVAVAARVTQ